MNDILNRLTVLLALAAFGVVAVIGFAAGVRPMVALFRATIAFVFFGIIGRLGFKVVLKGILEELAKHKKEQEEKREAAVSAAAAASAEEKPSAAENGTATE